MRSTHGIVIDASVARAAGPPESVHPTSEKCRDFLETVRKSKFNLIMSPDISAEWNRHQSRFARIWRVSMTARKRVKIIPTPVGLDLMLRIEALGLSENKTKAIAKDIHMVEAALITDKRVSSLDDVVKLLLIEISEDVAQIKQVSWINPDKQSADVDTWLACNPGQDHRYCLMQIANMVILDVEQDA